MSNGICIVPLGLRNNLSSNDFNQYSLTVTLYLLNKNGICLNSICKVYPGFLRRLIQFGTLSSFCYDFDWLFRIGLIMYCIYLKKSIIFFH